jgi:NAD(P)-dependent dehydrogenase (short-subunit alcohol dehydrogenase family)
LIPKDGIRAVITGAGGGLGRAFALRIAKDRGAVLITDVDEAGSARTLELVREAGGRGAVRRCDVRSEEEVAALVEAGEKELGGVDLVINNAGVAVAGNVGEVALEDWKWQIDINLWGVIHGCHAFVPHFRKLGRGHVINVASMAGLLAVPGMAPYNVTKFAVVALSEAMQGELRGSGVGVTVLCPSFFQTNIMNAARSTGMPMDVAHKRMAATKIQADQVADCALAAARKDELYALPHPDGKAMWGLKRLSPTLFQSLTGRLGERMRRAR